MKELHGLLENQEEALSAEESLKILVNTGVVIIDAQPGGAGDAAL